MRDYHTLDVWDSAMSFTASVYEFTARLPDGERFNLASQLRRAATSVPLNIAEGCGCSTDAEFSRFVGYAYRSLKEVIAALELCERLYRASSAPGSVTTLVDEGNVLSRKLHSLLRRLDQH